MKGLYHNTKELTISIDILLALREPLSFGLF